MRYLSLLGAAVLCYAVVTGCNGGSDVLPDPDRGFYEEVQSHARSYALAKLRDEDVKQKIRDIDFSGIEDFDDLRDLIMSVVADFDIGGLRIDRIRERYQELHEDFKEDPIRTVLAIIAGIKDVVNFLQDE